MSLNGIFQFYNWDYATRAFLKKLPKAEYDKLITHREKTTYLRGQKLFEDGDLPAGVFFIYHGKVKKCKNFKNREQIFYVAGAGELIGYHALLSNERYPDFAAALEECTVSFIPAKDFTDFLSRDINYYKEFLSIVCHEFTVHIHYLLMLTKGNAMERLTTALIIFREKSKDGQTDPNEIFVNVLREDLAHLASIVPDTAIRMLKKLEKQGVVDLDGRKIWVGDTPKLCELTGWKK